MKTYLLLLFIIAPVFLFSQIKIKNQPSAEWYATTWKMHQEKKIESDSLLKMKPSPFPQSFQDTLRKYDWVSIGSYMYVDKAPSVYYNQQPPQYNIIRLAENDTMIEFMYSCAPNFGPGQILHTNFKDTYWMRQTYTHKKINKMDFLELNYMKTSKEYLKLISYKNGILVYDIPMNGKVTDKKMFSRCVYMARKKEFTWDKTENK